MTEQQKEYIRKHYLTELATDMAKKLGIPRGTVGSFMYREKLSMPKERMHKLKSQKNLKPFTPEEDAFIRQHIETMALKEMCKILKRTGTYVNRRARELGYGDTLYRKRRKTYFQKGHVPVNKGKKQEDYMSPEAIARSAKTRFKKGMTSPAIKPDFYESVRLDKNGHRYIFIKCPKAGKMVGKQRWLWRKHHGAIPRGYNIVFKDGNTLNCVIENLECISHAELMQRNTLTKYPLELQQVIQLKNKLKRKINEQNDRKAASGTAQ